jgi:group I intron endonuclease
MVGVYKIINPKGKIYIGQSTDIENRWTYYYSLNCKGQTKLYNSLKKYGPKNHIFEVLKECKVEDLLEIETFYKLQYNTLNKGLNCRIDGKFGYDSDETKQKKSNSKLGNRYALGHSKSDHTKQIISNKMSQKNFYTDPSRIKKLSQTKSNPVFQYDLNGNFIKEWESAKIAAQVIKNKTNGSDIIACLKGRQKTAYGYKWKSKQ